MRTKNVWAHSQKEDGMWRAWLHAWGARFGLEVVWGKKASTGLRLHIGDRGSETPIDWHFGIWRLFTVFGNCNWPGLGKLCEKLGMGHKRDIYLRVHGGALWWTLWYDGESGNNEWHRHDKRRRPKLYPWRWGRDKHRGWMCLRDGNLDLNPLSAFWGHRNYRYEEVLVAEGVEMRMGIGEKRYLADLTLQRQTRRREHGPKWARGYSEEGYCVEVYCAEGIPYRVDDWKGDSVYGLAVKHSGNEFDWVGEAVDNIYSKILDMRARENWSLKQ